MQLSEVLEKHSVKEVSEQTNIAVESIKALQAEDFSSSTKAKVLGFISIIERDFHADLAQIREKALVYYETHERDDDRFGLVPPPIAEKRGSSKLTWLIVLGLLGYASWYFITNYDQRKLKEFLPFSEMLESEDTLSDNENGIKK